MPRSPTSALARGKKMKIDVATPPDIKGVIYKMFSIDHDPCPLHGLKTGPDALDRTVPWGKNNYVNPPYNEAIKDFVLRAVEESSKGNNSYFLIPWRPCTKYYDAVFENCTSIKVLHKNFAFVGYSNPYMWPLAIFCFEAGKPAIFERTENENLKLYELKK